MRLLGYALLAGLLAAVFDFCLRFAWHFARARIEQDREELMYLRAEVQRLRAQFHQEGNE